MNEEDIVLFGPPKKIKEIRFALLSPEEIRRMSVTTVVYADTYDDEGYPIMGGLMDPKLGVIDPGLKCRTCGLKFGECQGHFGNIELSRPVIHVGYAKEVYDVLKATCKDCSRLLLPEDRIFQYKEKLREEGVRGSIRENIISDILNEAAKKKGVLKDNKCPHCGSEQLKIKFEKPTSYKEGDKKLTASDIRERFENITDDDAYLVGWNPETARPEWCILTVLPVAPVTVRPSITLESGIRSEDDLTHKLVDIIRINQRLRENLDAGAPQLIVEDLWELLQYHVTTYFDNEVSGVPPARHRSGRVLKTLTQRLKGKEGRFRNNLSGKRVDFSARTVISPDPNISINEVGVPEFVAMELTLPERATIRNIERLRSLVRKGAFTYPGANYIIRPDGKRKRVTDITSDILAEELEMGYVVERHLQDGDIVLFNRQPSLHRLSIMAHEVRVMPYKTFRLNLCVCPPYNADFDGDEMNLHVPQTEESQAEARILMRVQEQIISPRFGEPVIGGSQDYLSGAYLLTKKGRMFDKNQLAQMLYVSEIDCETPEPAEIVDGVPYWTGKQIFSLLLPNDLNIEYKSKVCQKCDRCSIDDNKECKFDAYVVIENGVLKSGIIDGATFKARSTCKLLDKLVKDYGTDAGRKFLDSVTKLILWSNCIIGFSTGIDDEDIPKEGLNLIEKVLKDGKDKVNKLIDLYREGYLEPLPGRSVEETLESRIMQTLAESRDKAGSIAERYMGMDREAVVMARTGAKGNMLDLTQMSASLGQMSVRGNRLHRGYFKRSLSSFGEDDVSAEARGFVSSSYKKGLNPKEFFFHAMGGREGLVDTAVRTAQSGYMQRRLMNALQDMSVRYDGTVRTNDDIIVQFKYGEDGIDPAKSTYGKAVDIDWIIHKVLKSGKGA
ncbi:MAG: DNA-directed RNA polymerase subunit A' [Candidatus Methanofastidiosa archaeon]|nr:DNA-directed RNA polymerase subunit A' [Candidatus Methanofastidiosa archaeon]